MNKELQTKIEGYLKELSLTDVRKSYIEIGRRAQSESLSYEQYLLELLEQECELRRNRRAERWLKESGLDLKKSLEAFDLKRLPQKVKQQFNTLLDGQFLSRNENILVFGNPGSGKTHLVSALGQELIRLGKRVYCRSCAILLQELLLAKQELRLPKVFKKLSRYATIIIDDIGYVEQKKEEMEVLFSLLAQRYEQGSVMVTSNLPFSKWENIFKDPMMTAAVVDRIVHHSVILELNISSYRMEQAKNSKSEGKPG
ncbi:MAG: IS21-like element helper ATPase IstB [bacterium]